MSRTHNYVKGLTTGYAATFATIAVGLWLTPFTLRFLDREEYAIFALASDVLMWLGLLDIGYKGYAGYELCHPLPVVNGQTVGIDFVDKNAQLAAEYMRGILAEAKKQHAAS